LKRRYNAIFECSIKEEVGVDIIAAVRHWLDKEAKTKRWIDFEEAARQYELF